MEFNRAEKAKKLLTPALAIHTDLLIRKARGIYLEDYEGRKYMDFAAGLATANTGHNHPKIIEAIHKQTEAVIHAGCIFYHQPLLELAETLGRITPGGLNRCFFSNSGAEAVEGAMKLARYVTERQGIIAFAPSFHGRTLATTGLTASSIHYRRKYAPFLPSLYHAPYPYCFRCPFGDKRENCGLQCLEHLEWLFKHIIVPEETACIIIEPVLGEGGYVVPPSDFLKHLESLCDRWGILLIFDEVQAGMGRTGKWFAGEHFDIVPDIMTMAKGIASGMPISAVVSTEKIMDKWPPGSHGTTFGGNPVSCSAAIATVEIIENEGLLDNASFVGRKALERLTYLQEEHPCIGEVRGLGLMIGIEFVKEDNEPNPELVKAIQKNGLENGLVLLECGVDKSVIRLAPPLVVTSEEMSRALDIISDAIKSFT